MEYVNIVTIQPDIVAFIMGQKQVVDIFLQPARAFTMVYAFVICRTCHFVQASQVKATSFDHSVFGMSGEFHTAPPCGK